MTLVFADLVAAVTFLAFIASLLLTAVIRRYANRCLLDVPNERSSHKTPTPRGGGLAIGIVFLAVVGLLGIFDMVPASLRIALIGGGALVAAIGWLDDHRHVAAGWRVLVHLASAVWAVYWLNGFPSFSLGHVQLYVSCVGHMLAILGIVWMINLYNFMDGIDGLAADEAVTVALVAAGLLWWGGAPDLALGAALLAAACGGFLWWNWPPAKIFMGDVGSGFLGYCFAVLMLASEKAQALPLTAWLILLAVFVLDATYTLTNHNTHKEKWYTAHRSHAYQRLIQLGHPHVRVTSAVMLVNLLVLAPIAWLVVRQPVWTFVALAWRARLGWFVWRTNLQRFGNTSSHI